MSQALNLIPSPPISATHEAPATVSVLIPCYNSLPAVMRCLSSLVMTVDLSRTELLAQDDASPDYDLMNQPLPHPVKPERNARNLGFAGNINAAAQRARGDYLLLLNQDCRAVPLASDGETVRQLLRPGWLDAMLAVFEQYPDAGIVGPRLLFPNGAVQSVGGEFGADKGPSHIALGWSNPLDNRINYTREVSWITGAAIMIRRADFLALGGLRGDLYKGGYFEDVHLAMQMRFELGKSVYYCADATLVHEVGSTGGNVLFMRNSATFHRIWDSKIMVDNPFIVVGF